ncbi:DNA methylase N-4/N-6 domain-containing protein [Sphingopyxis sp. MC1]|nr:DNA methylase N-4/N-6 domain-containing protein [Sphingopyxis sp. MC1]
MAERSGRNDPLPTLLFETAAIAELRSTGHEVRKLDQKHVEAIARSITSHGFCVPILISGNLVVDGQARIAAATQLGIREVPAIQCQHLDEIQIRTLRW